MKKFFLAFLAVAILTGCSNEMQSNGKRELVTETQQETQNPPNTESDLSENKTEQVNDNTAEDTAGQADIKTENEEQSTTQETNAEQQDSSTEDVENNNYYAVCTGYSKTEVENFALTIKDLFLNKDWSQLADKISYPITIGNITCNSKEDFAKGDFAAELNEEFYAGMEKESCMDMFCNYSGIMFGDGQVWIAEVENELKIIGINP